MDTVTRKYRVQFETNETIKFNFVMVLNFMI